MGCWEIWTHQGSLFKSRTFLVMAKEVRWSDIFCDLNTTLLLLVKVTCGTYGEPYSCRYRTRWSRNWSLLSAEVNSKLAKSWFLNHTLLIIFSRSGRRHWEAVRKHQGSLVLMFHQLTAWETERLKLHWRRFGNMLLVLMFHEITACPF